MFLYLVIYMLNIIQIYSFILQDSFNIQMKDSAHFKIDGSPNEEDVEMINKEQLQRFSVNDKENMFYDLNKLASKEYSKTSRMPVDWFKLNIMRNTADPGQVNNHKTTVRVSPITTHTLDKRRVKEKNSSYDYDEIINEYYEETLYDDRLNETYHPKAVQSSGILHLFKRLVSLDIASSPRDANGVGFKAMHRLLVDYKTQQCSNKEISERLWKMLKIWFFIYLAVAIPLWSTTGWCCCCLCCKFFKPKQTIEEARLYLIQNPPGILKTRKGQTLYEPTDDERECYAEFEHLIRII